MKLPIEFSDRMKALLGEAEFNQFLESFHKPRYYGLRVNTLKISVSEFLKIVPFKPEPVPWTKDGFYYPETESPGKHPYYYAGLYYIQEPSAMYPGAVIDARPGERILDLCAAPGGKSVQVAAGLKGKGILVANDINNERVKALVKNIELSGVKNAVVTNESPQKLALAFRGYFDKILVDAPCSGEGMFRKDEDAVRSWENFKCEKCAKMQEDILTSAEKMLRPGGLLLYSTCTFSPEEDEKMISSFLENNKNYELLDLPKTGGIEDGRPDWGGGLKELSKTARLWPHKLKGEGHFTALLRKKDESSAPAFAVPLKSQRSEVPAEFYNFVRDNLNTEIEGHFDIKGNNLYCLPEAIPDLSGIKVAKFGWYLGEFVHGKFEPSHSMIISLKKEDIKNVLNLDSKSRDVLSYLKGETPAIELEKNGFAGVCVDGYTLGWAKQSGGTLKNLYPKGWRKMN